ncbi:MAG: 50S ribosomal protein L6 [Deltaproteobacteria bacterium]|nr:50S ribosomal protein L6 [Deltaproteobacteria bacterium]
MSRIGKLPITLPSGVKVEKKGQTVKIQGPKGTLEKSIPDGVEIVVEEEKIVVKPNDKSPKAGAYYGLTRSLIANMVQGVSQGFERVLEISGVGYRVAVQGNKLNFSLGYSHPVEYELPQGTSAEVDKQTVLKLKGADKELLGSMAAKIRSLRGPEPYKGKGIKYAEERIVRKAGKTGK